MEYSLLLVVALAFGISNKVADLLNEHGLKWFPGAPILLGVIWGVLGGALALHSAPMATAYLGLVLWWFLARKLDYLNHALAGVIIVICAVFMAGSVGLDVVALALILAAYAITGWLQYQTRPVAAAVRIFWRARLRLYITPLVYGLFISDLTPFWTTIAGMVGVEAIVLYYRFARGIA